MRDLFSMEDKVVVITGAAGHLGSAMTEGLLEFGASVVGVGNSERKPEEIVRNGRTYDRLFPVKCDISNTESVKEMFRRAEELCGKIDVLINCAVFWAGIGPDASIENMTDEDFARGMDGALDSTFRCTREVIPYLDKNGGGAIVNIGSMYGVVSPDPRIYGDSGQNIPAYYCTGKAGVLQLTRYSAAHMAKKNIRVNCIIPGSFAAPEKTTSEEFLRNLEGKTMLGRVGKPRELVGAVLLLSSDASSYMTGSGITVDGGWTAW